MVTDLRVWKGRLFASTGGCGAHSYGFQPALGMGDGPWSVVTTEFTYTAFDAGDELLLIDYRGGYVHSVGKNGIITRLADIPGAYRAFHHAGLVWITSITDNAVFQLDGQRFPIGGAFERTDEAMYLNSGCSVDGAIHVSDRHGSRILISRDGSSFSPSALPDSFAPTLWICDHPLGPLLVIQGNGALIRPAAALSEQPTGYAKPNRFAGLGRWAASRLLLSSKPQTAASPTFCLSETHWSRRPGSKRSFSPLGMIG